MKKPITPPIADADVQRYYKILGNHADPTACHPWPGGKVAGRGRFWLQGETRYAHQVGWLIERGPIPDCLELVRQCPTVGCCTTSHYKLGVAKQTTEENLRERFFPKVEVTDIYPYNLNTPCWRWEGSRSTPGYGKMRYQGRLRTATHIAWFLRYGQWPNLNPLFVRHACDNPWCVNPDHLHLGTAADDGRERVERGRTAKGEKNGSRTCPESVRRGEENGRSKLTAEQAILVRRTCAAYPDVHGLHSWLGRMFGVGHDTIGEIATGEKWRHLTDEFAPEINALTLEEVQIWKKNHPTGEACASSRVSDRAVREIRFLANQHGDQWGFKRRLAKRFGLSEAQVHRIVIRAARCEVADNFNDLGEVAPLIW